MYSRPTHRTGQHTAVGTGESFESRLDEAPCRVLSMIHLPRLSWTPGDLDARITKTAKRYAATRMKCVQL